MASTRSFKQAYRGIESIEVIADLGIDEDACVIESDIGQVEASMSGQIEALRASFERVFGAGRTDGDQVPALSAGQAADGGTWQRAKTPIAELPGA